MIFSWGTSVHRRQASANHLERPDASTDRNEQTSSSLGPKSHAPSLGPALVLAIVLYHAALGTFFAQDDIVYLSRAAGLEPSNWFVRPLSTTLAFRAQYAVFGLNPLGYHIINILLHLVNTAGVYALGFKLTGQRWVAGAAAVLFACSSIAFTPLHWATGVIELLTCTLLLAATLTFFESYQRGWRWSWAAAILAFAAMLSKETAAAWGPAMVLIHLGFGPRRKAFSLLLPAAIATVAFGLLFLLSGQGLRNESESYAHTASPLVLAQNLLTYVRWSVALWEPIHDVVAAIDPRAWRVAIPSLVVLSLMLWRLPRTTRHPVEVGAGWWLAFLLPVLSLSHHTYLYYLYIPWAGCAIALAAGGQRFLTILPRGQRFAIGCFALAGFVLLESHNIWARETATRDYLPVDGTIRDATLLTHALPTLRQARLARGTRVVFVNPVPRSRFDLITGAPTRPEDLNQRRSYYPLEAAMRDGATLRLFVPGPIYAGFRDTIPPPLEGAECFYFEQRGWLKPWGHGQGALLHQAEVQIAAQQWAAAERTLRHARALGDTLQSAMGQHAETLFALGRTEEGTRLVREFMRRWPSSPLAPRLQSMLQRP